MSAIFKPIGRAAKGVVSALTGVMGGKTPSLPPLLNMPDATIATNSDALAAQRAAQIKQGKAQGRASTLLTDVLAAPTMAAAPKTLLGG